MAEKPGKTTSERLKPAKNFIGFFTGGLTVLETILVALAPTTNVIAIYVGLGILLLVLIGVGVIGFFKPEKLFNKVLPEMPTHFEKILGEWWEIVRKPYSSAISYVTLSYDKVGQCVVLSAYVYKQDGTYHANWTSSAAHYVENRNELFYFWEGSRIDSLGIKQEGGGAIKFAVDSKKIDSGSGYYSDMIVGELQKTTKMYVIFKKCSEEDVKTMHEYESLEAKKLVLKKLEEYKNFTDAA